MISADDFNVDLLSGHVNTIILMLKCDSKYREVCFNRAFYNSSGPKTDNKSVFASSCFKTSCLPFVPIMLILAKSAEQGREISIKQPTLVRSLQ